GKTTILNMVAGLLEPTGGDVDVLGKQPRQARWEMSYMFARDALLPWRSAIANVEIGLELRGVAGRKRTEIARDLLRRMRLDGAENKLPSQLSHGMRQRVALARTWATDPKLLLMDEPFAALDAQTREAVRAEFLAFWEASRRTVIFVTHDLDEALLMADRVLLLGGGRILREHRVEFARPRVQRTLEDDQDFRDLRDDLRAYLQ
ncbi:MAG: ABC transporter ATP-binding protein, partial [Rhizobiaceae bacterium]|nr:ABC transporter ATP-binding protein [Rhizobiaceae bacterium]